jgi:hypothetical protein
VVWKNLSISVAPLYILKIRVRDHPKKKRKEKSLIMQEPGVEEWQAHIGHTAVR